MHERGVARARRRCFERRLARTGRGTGQIRASNEPPRRGLKIDISVFAPSSPRAVRRGAARCGASVARRLAGFRRLEEVGYAPLCSSSIFPATNRTHPFIASIARADFSVCVRPSARSLAPRRFIHPPDDPLRLSLTLFCPFDLPSCRSHTVGVGIPFFPRPLSPRRDDPRRHRRRRCRRRFGSTFD